MRLPDFEGYSVIAVPELGAPDQFIISEPKPECIDCGAPGPWPSARCPRCHAAIVSIPPPEFPRPGLFPRSALVTALTTLGLIAAVVGACLVVLAALNG